MSLTQFFIVWGCTLGAMLLCRCIPIFVLKGRDLPENIHDALELIPPAAFAALVANDLFNPGMFATGPWPGLIPLVAALLVVIVARFTNSLIWCIVTGVAAFACLSLI